MKEYESTRCLTRHTEDALDNSRYSIKTMIIIIYTMNNSNVRENNIEMKLDETQRDNCGLFNSTMISIRTTRFRIKFRHSELSSNHFPTT